MADDRVNYAGGASHLSVDEVIVLGDSLSDSGNMALRKVWGLFHIPGTGLDKSGDGRFANGLSWPGFLVLHWLASAADAIDVQIQDQLMALPRDDSPADDTLAFKREAKRNTLSALHALVLQVKALNNPGNQHADIDKNLIEQVNHLVTNILKPTNAFTLANGYTLLRNYAEGGASAATYTPSDTVERDLAAILNSPAKWFDKVGEFIHHPVKNGEEEAAALGAQAVVLNLETERNRLFEEDRSQGISADQKQNRLIVEWSGANDLITVNRAPTLLEAERAVNARIANLEALYSKGYRHFALFNLPNLALTPHYQADKFTQANRDDVTRVVEHFNANLKMKLDEFKSKHPDASTMYFDAYARFNEIYTNSEGYGFDAAKRQSCLCAKGSGYSPQSGINPDADLQYMFWNDVHPTSSVQAILAQQFMDGLRDQGVEFSMRKVATEMINAVTNTIDNAAANQSAAKQEAAALRNYLHSLPHEIKLGTAMASPSIRLDQPVEVRSYSRNPFFGRRMTMRTYLDDMIGRDPVKAKALLKALREGGPTVERAFTEKLGQQRLHYAATETTGQQIYKGLTVGLA